MQRYIRRKTRLSFSDKVDFTQTPPNGKTRPPPKPHKSEPQPQKTCADQMPKIGGRYALIINVSVSQSFAALCASCRKNLAAVTRFHSLSEAVLHLALSFFRLICAYHNSSSVSAAALPAFIFLFLIMRRINFCL